MQSPEGLRRATTPQPRPVGSEPEEEHDDDTGGEHVHLPPQSIWPVTVAGGVTLGGLGLVTTDYVSIVGVLVMSWGLYQWVQELRHEPH
ncbi:MAG TPA: cytochrome c oxidase subunit 4 [Chloroflexota bacterium]